MLHSPVHHRPVLITLLVGLLITGNSSSSAAGTWFVGLALGSGSGSLSDNIGRIPYDDVKIPTLYEGVSGPVYDLSVATDLAENLRVGIDIAGWSDVAGDLLSPDQLLSTVGLTWNAWAGLELAGGFGLGAARVTYLEQGIETTAHDTGLGVLAAVGWRHRLSGGLHLAPRLQWTGFASDDVQVWAETTAILVGLVWQTED